MAQLTEFGKVIKVKLVQIGRSQKWLIEEVSKKTGLYFDRSYMYKIQTGQLATPRIVEAIKEILDIEGPDTSNTIVP